jgi:hypothetical protein
MNWVLLDSSTRSNVISPITQRTAMTTRPNTKNAVPRWETCPTKARASNPLETATTNMLERMMAKSCMSARLHPYPTINPSLTTSRLN